MKHLLKPFRRGGLMATSLAALTIISSDAYPAVTVTFTKPDQFTDMPFSNSGRDEVFRVLQQHFEKLGAKLPAGQDLKVDVGDIDLAGTIEPARANSSADFRILRGGADWPMIKLRYAVEEKGKAIKSGEARVSDLNYLREFNRYSTNEPLRYERKMLDDWFAKEIAPARP